MSAVHVPRRSVAGALALGVALALVMLPAAAAAQEQPKRGGTLVVGLVADPMHLNPGIATDIQLVQVSAQIYSPLIKLDRNLNVISQLADKWDIAKDGLTYTFYLRKNVKWHDGKPFTSADVKFSLMEVNRKYNGPASGAFEVVESIETPDPYTVVFKLRNPFPAFFPWSMGTPSMANIVPKHIYEGTDPTKNDRNFNPVGTGPFVFKEWVRGSHITLERNPDYFKPGQPYLDRIVFKIIPDAGARVIALEKGEIDHLTYVSLPTSAIGELSKKQDIDVVIDKQRSNYGVIIAFFNLRHPQLKVKEVRHAIAYAIDRKALVDKALSGLGDPGSSPMSSHMKKFYNPNVPKHEFDPARANQLLNQAGFSRKADGTRFGLRFSFQRAGEAGALDSAAEMIREQLRAVGVDLQLQPMDGAAWMDSSQVKWDFDLTMGSFMTGPDPAIGTSRLYLTENIKPLLGRNLMGYSNPKVDELFKMAEREIDETRRVAIYHEIQNLMVEDLPALWLWDKFSPIAQRKIVKGELPSGSSHTEDFEGIWLSTAEGGQGATSGLIIVGAIAMVVVAGGVLLIRRLRAD